MLIILNWQLYFRIKLDTLTVDHLTYDKNRRLLVMQFSFEAGIHEIKLEQGCTLMTDHFELTAADSGSWVASARIQLAENLGESLNLEKEAGLPSGRKMQAVLEQQQKLWEAVDAVKRKDEWLFEDGETHSKAVFGATAAALLGAVVALGTLGLLFTIYRCKRRDGGGHIGGTGA